MIEMKMIKIFNQMNNFKVTLWHLLIIIPMKLEVLLMYYETLIGWLMLKNISIQRIIYQWEKLSKG